MVDTSPKGSPYSAVQIPPVVVGVVAYNEEQNIAACLAAILSEDNWSDRIQSLVVIASGCTDRTVEIVQQLARRDPRIRLVVEGERRGKAGAINRLLAETSEPICAIVGADITLTPLALPRLLAPFSDSKVGMTGTRPIPTNNRRSAVGAMVHAMWAMHHELALLRPKLGEAVAFRRIVPKIDSRTLVDEVTIEQAVTASGLVLRYVPEAVVRNHGPETISDLVRQRTRIHKGHKRILAESKYRPSTMNVSAALLAGWRAWRHGQASAFGTMAFGVVDVVARFFATMFDKPSSHPGTWPQIVSSKRVVLESRGATDRLLSSTETGRVVGSFERLWSHFKNDRFYRDSALFTLALLCVNVTGFVLNVLLSRLLRKDWFAEVTALMSVVAVFNVIAVSTQNFLAREIAQRRSSGNGTAALAMLSRPLLVSAGAIAVLGLAFSPFIASFLRLESVVPAVLLSLVASLSLIVPLYRGALQGVQRFRPLTLNVGLEGFLRLAVAVALVAAGLQVSGVLAGVGAGMVVAIILGRISFKSDTQRSAPSEGTSGPRIFGVIPILAGTLLLNSLFNVDVILAKHYLPATLAADYSAMSLLARAAFYLTGSIGAVVLAAESNFSPHERRTTLWKGLAIVLTSALAVEALYVAASPTVIATVFGASYSRAATWLPLLGIGSVALAGANLIMFYLIAHRRYAFTGVLALALSLEICLLVFRHAGLGDIAAASAAASILSFVMLVVLAVRAVNGRTVDVPAEGALATA